MVRLGPHNPIVFFQKVRGVRMCWQPGQEPQLVPGRKLIELSHEFEELTAQASADASKTLARARKAVDLTRLDAGKGVSGTARKQSRDRARALATKLGLTA